MKTSHKAVTAGAGAIAIAITFTPIWEGMDLVAKRDMIGTGNPITYCNGLTSHDGAVRVGQRFTPDQCKALLAKTLPKYWDEIEACIKVDLPVKTAASLLDAEFNTGAVCKSPMLAKMNAGNLAAGCEAFSDWYITTKNHGVRKVIPGLVNRRNGDTRLGEKELCLQGVAEGIAKTPAATGFWTKLINFLKGLHLWH